MSRDQPSPLIDPKPWQRRASPLARGALLAYTALIVYAGLAPWSGWRDLGVSPWAFLASPVPRHVTAFDLIVNVLGYVPFGALLVLALHPRLRGLLALAAAGLAGLLLAGGIEALQTYLPRRVASNLDLATNAAGGLLGAVLVLPFAASLIDRGRLAQLRARWFTRESSALLVVLALWPAAQTAPAPMLFANGLLIDGPTLLVDLGLTTPVQITAAFGAAEFVLAEAVVVVAGMLAAGLALTATLQPGAPRIPLLLLLVAAALLARGFAYATAFGPEQAFIWLTPGAIGGLCLGTLVLLVAAQGRPHAVYGVAWLAALVWIVTVNLVPENPYHVDWLANYRPGRLAHFRSASIWVAQAWPLLLLAALAALPWSRGLRRR
jgi:VanZ family protein